MSTRGAYGFKCKNQKKILFSFSDSYFNSLGEILVDFIKTMKISRMRKQVNKLIALDKKSKLSDPKYWDDPKKVLQNIYLGIYTHYFDAHRFIEDELFCEYYYLIDLDTNKFEVYLMGDSCFLKSYDLNNIPDSWQAECKAISDETKKNRQEYILKISQK